MSRSQPGDELTLPEDGVSSPYKNTLRLYIEKNYTKTMFSIETAYTVSQKNPPYGFLKFFPKRLGIFNQFLHTYYTIISILDYKFLLTYFQL